MNSGHEVDTKWTAQEHKQSALLELLRSLRLQGLTVVVTQGKAKVRGGALDERLRKALSEHREEVLKIFRPAPAGWRARLWASEPEVQELWVLHAKQYEEQGDFPAMAEFLAWHTVSEYGE